MSSKQMDDVYQYTKHSRVEENWIFVNENDCRQNNWKWVELLYEQKALHLHWLASNIFELEYIFDFQPKRLDDSIKLWHKHTTVAHKTHVLIA